MLSYPGVYHFWNFMESILDSFFQNLFNFLTIEIFAKNLFVSSGVYFLYIVSLQLDSPNTTFRGVL